MYFTTSTEYALPYFGTKKIPTVLVSYVISGNAFPVIEHPKRPKNLMGAAIRPLYHSHYVITRKDGLPLPRIPDIGQKYYDEVVIEQEPCILPVYLFKISTDNLPKMLFEHAKEQELLMAEAKEKEGTVSIEGNESRTIDLRHISEGNESRTIDLRHIDTRLIDKNVTDTVEDKTDTRRDTKRIVDDAKKRTTSKVPESVDTNYHLLDDKLESSSSSDESKQELEEM